jgi:hypothetical protein
MQLCDARSRVPVHRSTVPFRCQAHPSHQVPTPSIHPIALNASRGAPFVLVPTTDLVFYALGCGEYDEMAREWRLPTGA